MHLAPCTTLIIIVIIIFYNGWPAKMGHVPFWQPSTLCFVAVIVHHYCVCIVENKPLSPIVIQSVFGATKSTLLTEYFCYFANGRENTLNCQFTATLILAFQFVECIVNLCID